LWGYLGNGEGLEKIIKYNVLYIPMNSFDSPTIQERKLEHRIEVENKKQEQEQEIIENTWSSCCFHIDRRACKFVSQMVTLASIMTFCVVQLIRLDKCDSDQYLGILTLCIGVVIPSPIFKKRENIDT
jgi:hypothetical protein